MDKALLKKKMLQYKQDPSEKNLCDLLAFIDPHLETCINVLKSKFPELKRENPQDLYHYAIIALTKAAKSLTVEHDAEMLDTRIYFYFKSEIFQVYNIDRKQKEFTSSSIEEECVDMTGWDNLVLQDLEAKVQKLIERREIPQAGYNMVIDRILGGFSLYDLRKKYGIPIREVKKMINYTIKRIRELLNPDDFI